MYNDVIVAFLSVLFFEISFTLTAKKNEHENEEKKLINFIEQKYYKATIS